MKKILRAVALASLLVLALLIFGVGLTFILNNIQAEWAITICVLVMITMIAFIIYKIE